LQQETNIPSLHDKAVQALTAGFGQNCADMQWYPLLLNTLDCADHFLIGTFAANAIVNSFIPVQAETYAVNAFYLRNSFWHKDAIAAEAAFNPFGPDMPNNITNVISEKRFSAREGDSLCPQVSQLVDDTQNVIRLHFLSARRIILSEAVFTSEVASIGYVPKDYQGEVIPSDPGHK
jgi:hypothetical protein